MTTFLCKSYAFLKRDVIESLSYKYASILDLFGIIAQALTFFFIAKLVDPKMSGLESSPLGTYSGDYFGFVLVGLAAASFQTTALGAPARAIGREQGAGTLEAILITPTSLYTVLFSGSLWSFIWAFVRFSFFLIIGSTILGADLSNINFLTLSAVMLLTLTSLLGLGLMSAGFLLAFKRGDPLSFLLNGLSKFLGGVYFPVSILPIFFKNAAYFFPIAHTLEALRKAILQNASLSMVRSEILFLLIFSLVLIPTGLIFFNASVRKTKKDGSLAFV